MSGSKVTAAEPMESNQPTSPPVKRIDTHHHFLPKIYVEKVGVEKLAQDMPNGVAPSWSVESALEMMEENGIEKGVLSLSSGPRLTDPVSILRNCNDEAARLKGDYPRRFGSFASLPLPLIAASLREIEYSADTLGVEGFIIFTHYDGAYLGDAQYNPIWEELNRRRAVVFIHPHAPPYQLLGLPPDSLIEYPFETTRAATSLIMNGCLSRYPNIRFILSHAGGTLPFLAGRIAGGIRMNPALLERIGDPLNAIRTFYFDTALSGTEPALRALLSVADPDRIIFGTDFPMAPRGIIAQFNHEMPGLVGNEELSRKIYRNNALELLSR